MYNNLIKKLFSDNIPVSLNISFFPTEMTLLVLAPHPDDFDVIGITLKRFRENDNPITLAVILSGASGMENSYLRNAGNSSVKALIREREQYESILFFGLQEDELFSLRAEEDENGDILENELNLQLIKDCLEKIEPDILFMPHWDDTNTGHRRSYKLVRKAMSETAKDYLLFLNKVPRTISMPVRFYSAFNENEAVWKRQLLKHHASQQEREFNTRGHGFDYRILEFNRKCAMEIAAGE